MDSFEIKFNDSHSVETENDADTFLHAIFQKGLKAYGLLKNAIEREFRRNGAPEVLAMNIDRVKYNRIGQTGTFRVVLNINYTFGCEDLLVEKKEQTSEWSFIISKDHITFNSSPYAEERSTADEF